MRPRAPFLIAGLALVAAGCSTVAPSTPAPSVVDAAAPQPVADHDWFFNLDGDTAHLAYGLAESDDLRLGMNCRRGSGQVELGAMAESGARAEIHLEAGGETERLPARREPSEVHDGVFLIAGARTSEPVMLRFRQVGWLAQWRDGARETYVPAPASRGRIERFFAFCG